MKIIPYKLVVLFALLNYTVCAYAGGDGGTGIVEIIDVPKTAPFLLETYTVQDSSYGKVITGKGTSYGVGENFVSNDGQLRVEYSEYEQLEAELIDWPGDEFMYFLEGRVEITSASGKTKTYRPGDMLVMPRGFNGIWKQLAPVRKISVTYGWPQ